MNWRYPRFCLFLLISFVVSSTAFCSNEVRGVFYGSSAYTLPRSVQEYVFSGFMLALKNTLGEEEAKRFLLQDQRAGKSAIEAEEIVQSILTKDPLAIFGFPSTHESQLVSQATKDSSILTVFASSTNSNLKNLSRNIFSTSDDPRRTIAAFKDVIKEKRNWKRGLVLYYTDDFFSLDQKGLWANLAKTDPSLNLDFLAIDNASSETTVLNAVKSHDYIVVTSFPNKAFDFLTLLNQNRIDVPILTNTSWYKVNFELLSRLLSTKKKEVFMVDAWDKTIKNSKNFESLYIKTYHSRPGIESAIGYELGLVLSELIHRRKAKNSFNFIALLNDNPCFKGGPLGDFCFEPNGGFARRNLQLIVLKNGRRNVVRSIGL